MLLQDFRHSLRLLRRTPGLDLKLPLGVVDGLSQRLH